MPGLRLYEEDLLEPSPFSSVSSSVVRGGMAATPENLLTMVGRLPDRASWQVIAIGQANLQLTAMGLALGGHARAGLEDTLYLRKGELAPGNRPLVERAVRLARDPTGRWPPWPRRSRRRRCTRRPDHGLPPITTIGYAKYGGNFDGFSYAIVAGTADGRARLQENLMLWRSMMERSTEDVLEPRSR